MRVCVYAMAMPTALKALTFLFVLAVLAPDQSEGQHHQPYCPSFSCGPFRNISSPFRQASDPPGCGYPSYELVCSDTKATIHIDNVTYHVSAINDSGSYFWLWVVDADMDLYSSCPLPRWNRPPYSFRVVNDEMEVELDPLSRRQTCFLKCSREVKDNGMYMPVACLSSNDTYVYVLTGYGSCSMEYLEPSCGYLAMTPWPCHSPSCWDYEPLENASYVDVVKSMRIGFAVQFPFRYDRMSRSIKECLILQFREDAISCVLQIIVVDGNFWRCLLDSRVGDDALSVVPFVFLSVKWLAVLCRFVLAPLAVLILLAHKYWKTRITIDAVEKFLRMQQMLGPMRYAYTDITTITSHFRDKLGQGGYGSVFKGVILPGKVHVAVKMLEGNPNCNGEDFINEVSTIGRIHHVNVVRLMGFCSEEMRRALVYEYMPQGSLDKYIFLAKKSFS
uniref:Protein kinase domain-containing protein n=1 Tax=Aegilops tauschii subsp. strangulata TaxID=200361 RepID=A0A453DPY9_AEGTS